MVAVAWNVNPVGLELSKRTPEPGYECKIKDRGDFGLIQADLQVSISGETRADYVKWDAGDRQFQNPWVTAAFFREKDGSYSLDHGHISVMWHIWDSKPNRIPKAQKLRLELTTNPDLIFQVSRMTGELERSAGPFYLQVGWSDTVSLASGSSQLFLVARDSHYKIVDRVALDRKMFGRAEPHIQAALDKVERMVSNPRVLCTHLDDLGTDDIVVT